MLFAVTVSNLTGEIQAELCAVNAGQGVGIWRHILERRPP